MRRMMVAGVLAAGGVALAGVAGMGAGQMREAGDASGASYEVDPVHSVVLFRIRHAGGASNFYGRFNRIDASRSSFTFDPAHAEDASFVFVIDNASVDTGNTRRDNHLRSPDFFNVAQFPTTSFKSTGIEPAGDGTWRLRGELSLHGVTKEIEAELKWIGEGSFGGRERGGFEASFEIKRSDFGITQYLGEDGGENGPLGNTVGVLISVEGMK